ncbi:MAG: ribosome small subunit-dependent GTPase A [Cyclobacteriaceae bacterium]
MALEMLGFGADLEEYRKVQGLDGFEVGRVISEHKDRYEVQSTDFIFDAELIGNMRFSASSRLDLPAVGDWVAFSSYDEGKALIHALYPRKSLLERQAVGRARQRQIIAANIDTGLIVQAVDRDFNLNRLERYITICYGARVSPVVVLSKTDLISGEDLKSIIKEVSDRIKGVPLVTVSSMTEDGYSKVAAFIEKGKTYCLLGSSGVGKSTLMNSLSGISQMATGAISTSVNKGKHVTSHRELVVLGSGAILIDNPGMREVGITDAADGLETTFDEIMQLSQQCKFKDCTHINEVGCMVLAALQDGALDEDAYKNFHKMQREKNHFESSVEEKRKKDKSLGKLFKSVKQDRKNRKY